MLNKKQRQEAALIRLRAMQKFFVLYGIDPRRYQWNVFQCTEVYPGQAPEYVFEARLLRNLHYGFHTSTHVDDRATGEPIYCNPPQFREFSSDKTECMEGAFPVLAIEGIAPH